MYSGFPNFAPAQTDAGHSICLSAARIIIMRAACCSVASNMCSIYWHGWHVAPCHTALGHPGHRAFQNPDECRNAGDDSSSKIGNIFRAGENARDSRDNTLAWCNHAKQWVSARRNRTTHYCFLLLHLVVQYSQL